MGLNYVLRKDARDAIALRYAAGEHPADLADEFGVTRQAIYSILRSRMVPLRRPSPAPGWITANEAAAMLGISRGQVTHLVAAGRLSGQRFDSPRTGRVAPLYVERRSVEVLRQRRDQRPAFVPQEARPIDFAYLAGLFDGEGSVFIRSPQANRSYKSWGLTVAVAMTDPEIINWIQSVFGGRVQRTERPPNQTLCRWVCSGPVAAAALRLMLPFLRVKARQAGLALEFQERLESYGARRWNTLTDEEQAWRRQQQLLISSLNTRQGNRGQRRTSKTNPDAPKDSSMSR